MTNGRIGLSNIVFLRFAVLLLLVATTPFLAGQGAGNASLQGNIVDQTGAVIPDAAITLTNAATSVTRSAVSDTKGQYSFPNAAVGTYNLSVTKAGFQTYTQTGIVLEVGSAISVNVPMTVGSQTERVEVKAEGLALQTEDASFKQTIDQQTVTEMPLNGRQMTGLITLSGGSTPAPGGDFTGSKYTYQTISVSIAGGMGNTTMWRLDGGSNNDYMANGNLPFPFPDAVSQFSVESTALSAQNGMHTGGLVNVVTRSGTNQFHGSAFEFIRNNFINATNFFSTTKDTLHQNQYGGTFGGPILKDRLFAFAGYQRTGSKQTQARQQAFVPTAANLAGDWSATDGPNCTSNGKTIQLVDPRTGAKLVGNKYPGTPSYSPQALKLVSYLPKIDPATDTNNCGLVRYSIPLQTADNQFVTRVDYTINAKHNLYGRYFIDGYQQPAFFFPDNILVTTQAGLSQRVQSFTLGDAYTLSPKIVNTAHITVLRRRNNRGYAANNINANDLGVDLYQNQTNGLQLSTSNKFTIGGGTNSNSKFNDNTFAVEDDITMMLGKHQLVFGGEYARNQLNIANSYESNGTFTFDGRYSQNGPGGGSAGGDSNLDLLMGTIGSFEQSKQQQNALRGPIPSLYLQDTYHPTSGVTLVAGLRWSPNFMPYDYFHRGVVFDYNAFMANKVSSVYPNAPAGAMYFGDPGVSDTFTKNAIWQFSPNVGISFDPTGSGKTVFRAGAEIAYDQVNYFTAQRNQQNPPYATAIKQTQTSTSGPINFASPWSAGTVTTNPFPQPQIPTPAIAKFFPQSQFIVLPKQFHPSYAEQWTVSIQRQFGNGWQFQTQYVGSHTVHAPMGTPLSPALFVPGVWGANGTGCPGVVTTGPAGKPAGAAGTPCSTVANQTQRFALTVANPLQGNGYTGGGGGTVLVNYTGMANYNGLITTIQHRLSSSFSLLANHTWSKCLSITDAQGDYAGTNVQNPNNPAADYGPCGSDYRNIENVVLITKSAFSMTGIKAWLVNNWVFAPLVHIQSGAPFNVTSAQDNSFTAIGNDRPNLVPGVPIYLRQTIRSATGVSNRGYLNPAAFAHVTAGCPLDPKTNQFSPLTCPGYGTYGNSGKNGFRGPTSYQFDAQVSRIFPIHESLAATLRLEAFNVLNHPNFSNPTTTLTSGTFGQVSSTSNQARIFQGSVKITF
ncbi:MAG TPA: carboxypeptidase regulatory-like domain-containing protein [Edaphobacter sp.]